MPSPIRLVGASRSRGTRFWRWEAPPASSLHLHHGCEANLHFYIDRRCPCAAFSDEQILQIQQKTGQFFGDPGCDGPQPGFGRPDTRARGPDDGATKEILLRAKPKKARVHDWEIYCLASPSPRRIGGRLGSIHADRPAGAGAAADQQHRARPLVGGGDHDQRGDVVVVWFATAACWPAMAVLYTALAVRGVVWAHGEGLRLRTYAPRPSSITSELLDCWSMNDFCWPGQRRTSSLLFCTNGALLLHEWTDDFTDRFGYDKQQQQATTIHYTRRKACDPGPAGRRRPCSRGSKKCLHNGEGMAMATQQRATTLHHCSLSLAITSSPFFFLLPCFVAFALCCVCSLRRAFDDSCYKYTRPDTVHHHSNHHYLPAATELAPSFTRAQLLSIRGITFLPSRVPYSREDDKDDRHGEGEAAPRAGPPPELTHPGVAVPATTEWWCSPEPEARSDVWFRYSPPPRKPPTPAATKKASRRPPEKLRYGGGGKQGSFAPVARVIREEMPVAAAARAPVKGSRRVVRPVDEDLYQVPPPEFDWSRRPPKKRAARRRSLWMGCLGGLGCIAGDQGEYRRMPKHARPNRVAMPWPAGMEDQRERFTDARQSCIDTSQPPFPGLLLVFITHRVVPFALPTLRVHVGPVPGPPHGNTRNRHYSYMTSPVSEREDGACIVSCRVFCYGLRDPDIYCC
ncbi:hypothetical protein HU200_053595 [Digitaria exilis]|uniref:Uncharacterized protein n=1 Tax=Digitaria exilis TaxID=1010633 RepID=A0A835E4Z1_9POAL|nr:hypothetical protein HU200_053595 [Digitaria exilis]